MLRDTQLAHCDLVTLRSGRVGVYVCACVCVRVCALGVPYRRQLRSPLSRSPTRSLFRTLWVRPTLTICVIVARFAVGSFSTVSSTLLTSNISIASPISCMYRATMRSASGGTWEEGRGGGIQV